MKPYKINDTKNHTAYFALIYGLLNNNLDVIKKSIKDGAKINKLKIDKDRNNHEDNYSKIENLLSVKEYANLKCDDEIFEYIAERSKLTPEEQSRFMLKRIQSSQYTQFEENQESIIQLKKDLEIFLKKNDVNKLYSIEKIDDPSFKRYKSKKTKVTLLHVACHHWSYPIVKFLLEKGANPNLKTTIDGYYPAQLVTNNTESKGDQYTSESILKELLLKGANFDYKANDGDSLWRHVISIMKVPNLIEIMKTQAPNNLEGIASIKKKSPSLFKFWRANSNGFKSFPLIESVLTHEKIIIGDFQVGPNSDSFFKEKSLKKALEKRYGISSSRLTSLMDKHVLERVSFNNLTYKKLVINTSLIEVADLLSLIFLKRKNPNMSDFLDILESNQSSLAYSCDHFIKTSKKQIANFFIKNFKDEQIKILLINKEGDSESLIEDIVAMYKKFEKPLFEKLKLTNFKEFNTLQKLHDFLNESCEMLKQKNFPLNQEDHNPKLNKVKKLDFMPEYGVKLAENSHELIRWGTLMDHCVGSSDYAEEASNGRTIILAITHKEEPKYCVEITPGGDLSQVQGKSSSTPPKAVMSAFMKKMKAIGIINKSQKVSNWV